jgi:hypothetical protein
MTLERADVGDFSPIIDLDEQGNATIESSPGVLEAHRSQLLNVGHQALHESVEVTDDSVSQEALAPLSAGVKVRIDELFYGPFNRKHGLSVGDIDALVHGLKELHGEFDERTDMLLLDECLGMLLRGLHKKDIAQNVGATPSEVNRMIAHFMRNVRKTIIPHRAEAERRMAAIIDEDRALTGRQPLRMRVYTPPAQAEEERASQAVPIKKAVKKTMPLKKTPAKKVQPLKSQTPRTAPAPTLKKNEQRALSSKRPKAQELDLSKNRNLFTRALLRPDVEQAHFDEELGKSLTEASDNGIIPSGYKEMLLDDLSYGLKDPRIKGSVHEARMFVFRLGKTFPGRLSVDSQQNIAVMRGLFALYGQRGLTIEVLEKASSEKVPVRLLVAGAVTEVLNTATAATVASRNV